MILPAVEASSFGFLSVFPERVPVFIDVNGTQTDHTLRTRGSPAHPCEFQSIVDEVATSAFNDTASDGVSFHQAYFIAHVFSVPFQVSDHLAQAVPLGAGEVVLGKH